MANSVTTSHDTAGLEGRSTDALSVRATTSWWGDVWRRFLRQKLAVTGAIVLVVLFLMAILAPLVAPYDPIEQFRNLGLNDLGQPRPPSTRFLLGTDGLGRDVLSRLLWGGRMSLGIGISSSAIAVIIGLVVGGTAGFTGGVIDFVLMRFVDLMMSVPTFFLMLLLVVILSPGAWVVVTVIALFGWTYPARIFRSQVLYVREQEYIVAARCIGAPGRRIFLRHLLPQVLPLMIVYLALNIPTTIFAEASLSFLGLGVPPPMPSWGSMIQSGMPYYRIAPWVAFFPGMIISVTVICFNLLGTGLREAMDPTRRGQ
jgi:peptide/nickel transport system permease protein